MTVNLADLTSLEQVYLGIVAVGLPPFRLVGDPWLRLDYLSAVSLALLERKPSDTYLAGQSPEPREDFLTRLRLAIHQLEERDVVGVTPPSVFFASDPTLGRVGKTDVETIDPNAPPMVFDSFLSQQCMNMLLGIPEIYRFIMDKYAESSEHWQRLVEQGYGEGPHL